MLPATDVFFWPMSNLFIDILNYAVRISIVLLGILIAGGFVMQMPGEEWYSRGTGGLLIVFGAYRLILYYAGVQRRRREDQEDGGDDQDHSIGAAASPESLNES